MNRSVTNVVCYSGVGGGDAGDARAPPKVLICGKFGQNVNEFGHKCFDIL